MSPDRRAQQNHGLRKAYEVSPVKLAADYTVQPACRPDRSCKLVCFNDVKDNDDVND